MVQVKDSIYLIAYMSKLFELRDISVPRAKKRSQADTKDEGLLAKI